MRLVADGHGVNGEVAVDDDGLEVAVDEEVDLVGSARVGGEVIRVGGGGEEGANSRFGGTSDDGQGGDEPAVAEAATTMGDER